MRFFLTSSFALCSLVFASGCVTEPAVKLYGARISHVTPAGVGLTMTVKVQNDNSFDVMVRGVRTNVSLAGRYMLPPIAAEPQVWLPSGRATLVQVPVVIPWTMVTPLVQTTLGFSTIKYRMVGYADVTATRALEIDFDDYKFDQEGAFSRADLVMAAGRGFFSEGSPETRWAFSQEANPTQFVALDSLAKNDPRPYPATPYPDTLSSAGFVSPWK